MIKHTRSGLYVITDDQQDCLVERVNAAIQGGAIMVQYRNKKCISEGFYEYAKGLLSCCRSQGVPLIINDDVKLASMLGADGVHLGKNDTALIAARAELGPNAIIGVSCYNSLARAEKAQKNGADYVAFGRFFESKTKPEAVPASFSLLYQAKQMLDLPIVAIGGITPENGKVLLQAGADMLAVIHGVFGQPNILQAARGYRELFEC